MALLRSDWFLYGVIVSGPPTDPGDPQDPEELVYDIEFRAQGASEWTLLAAGQTTPSGMDELTVEWDTSSLAAGWYEIRARERNLTTQEASAWTEPTLVRLLKPGAFVQSRVTFIYR